MEEKRFLGGLLIAGIPSLVCCIGPGLALGLGRGGLLALLVTWRKVTPIFSGVIIVALGAAFYRTYKPKEIRGEDESRHLLAANAETKDWLWTLTLLAVGFLAAPYVLVSMAQHIQAAN